MPIIKEIDRGTPNGNNGDDAREGAKKINDNFRFLYNAVGDKKVYFLDENTVEKLKDKINNDNSFEILYPESFLFIAYSKITNPAETVKKTYRLLGKKRGSYGYNNTYIGFENLELINAKLPDSSDLQNTPGTRTINYGLLNISIKDHINQLQVPLTLQDSNEKITILKADVNSVITSFIYKGPGGTFGNGFPDLTNSDIELLNEKSQDLSIEDNSISESKFTQAVKAKLNLFTQALKTAYNTASNWVQNNGQNVLNHLQSSSNPHSVTATQVGVESGAQSNVQSDFSESDNTKDTFIKNKPDLSNLGGQPEYLTLDTTATSPANPIDMSNQMVNHYNWTSPTNEIQFNLVNQAKGGIAIIRVSNNTTGQPGTVNINGDTSRRICLTDNWFDGEDMEIYLHQYGSAATDYEWWYNKKQR